jgi:hypothetical protein
MVAHFKSVGSNDDVAADHKRTSIYKFIYPKRYNDRDSKKRMDTDPKHLESYEWILDGIYDIAREVIFRRNRYEDWLSPLDRTESSRGGHL